MKVVALVSGGKDSCFAMMKCIQYGHEIVALANLIPADDATDELDSYMYQTVGHQIVVSYAKCMGLPLFRRRIQGSTRHHNLSYSMTPGDEVEDMFILLNEVKRQIPSVDAVSSGAIASDYQRLRVESVCSRLGLVSLAYLWKQDQLFLLQEMIRSGIIAILVKDSSEPSMTPIEESHSYNWHDDQLQISSIFAQHGVCLFAKEIASLGPNTAYVYEVDLAWEMLTSTNSTMALGKMVGQSRRKHEGLHLRLPRICRSFRSKADPNAYNLLQSVVPLRSHIALKGDSFHEYLSSLSQISRFGTTRLSESIGRRKQRRARGAQHYLRSGRLALSQEDVSLLGQYNCYQKVSPGSGT